ncbi:alpha-L-rhamnosidase [Alteromonas sp. KUL49]|uniref:alpha-L-rhamnosidase n=1 Tax=Alteromonas sp. KUL49 TaxID=2480798 RepID=UPI0010FFAE6A|nr:alpha-L-rhamnosidase [Alteromonas sp. KUL49]GEA09877.1 alpha-rhamnosidase [Alteromonas sp. KUL49]
MKIKRVRFSKLISLVVLSMTLFACTTATESVDNVLQPSNLRVEDVVFPLNVHSETPNLSWHANLVTQSHYQIQVASSLDLLVSGAPDLWDSGKIKGQQSLHVPYSGEPLFSRDTAYWRVRVWSSENATPTPWSDTGVWEVGLVNHSDWQAKWLQVALPEQAVTTPDVMQWMRYAADLENPKLPASKVATQERVLKQLEASATAGLFRYEFDVSASATIVKARLHSTAGGYYEIFINGSKVDDRIMDPGQTDFDKRILYNTDDVVELVETGTNVIAVHLGSGWYDEAIAFSKWDNPDAAPGSSSTRSLSFGQPTFIAQLELTYSDGSTQVVATSDKWLTHASPVLKEGLFSGELFDANQQIEGWNDNTDIDVSTWVNAKALEHWPTQVLEPQRLPPITAQEQLTPVEIFHPKEGVWVYDFGQNFTGVPTLDIAKLGLAPQQAVFLRYGEWVDAYGNVSLKSGGGAPLLKQADGYIASDTINTTWTPSFTWHGFRYVEVTGLSEAPPLDAISAHLVRSNVDTVGQFESSDPLINRIHDTALWGYESNLMALPMDCPIRERAGWTGDAHAALITGNYNFDMTNFWSKYLGDFRTAAFIAPAVVPGKRTHGPNFDWAAAEVMIAWEHYRHNGDIQLLKQQYESMLEYMNAGEAELENNLLRKGYGDWCDPVVTPGTPRVNGRCSPQHTTPTQTSSAFYAHTANLMSKIANVLNKPNDVERFSTLFNTIANQFNVEFFDQQSSSYGSQTANALAIMLDIAPDEIKPKVAKAIHDDVVNNWRGHASVGALGQTYVYRALSDYGYADTAFNIFKAEGYPGYQYLFEELNATTLWERKGFYDPKQDPDGTIGPGFSLNHPFHSGYDGWFYEGLGGIRPFDDTVGYQQFHLKPQFVTGLDWVKVSYETGYGVIESRWRREAGKVTWEFTIPNNTQGFVDVNGNEPKWYTAGHYTLSISE